MKCTIGTGYTAAEDIIGLYYVLPWARETGTMAVEGGASCRLTGSWLGFYRALRNNSTNVAAKRIGILRLFEKCSHIFMSLLLLVSFSHTQPL